MDVFEPSQVESQQFPDQHFQSTLAYRNGYWHQVCHFKPQIQLNYQYQDQQACLIEGIKYSQFSQNCSCTQVCSSTQVL